MLVCLLCEETFEMGHVGTKFASNPCRPNTFLIIPKRFLITGSVLFTLKSQCYINELSHLLKIMGKITLPTSINLWLKCSVSYRGIAHLLILGGFIVRFPSRGLNVLDLHHRLSFLKHVPVHHIRLWDCLLYNWQSPWRGGIRLCVLYWATFLTQATKILPCCVA